MAQATRCPHCQTAFKVVRDQLLLREGWVRCGHCGEAFNALDHLIDLTAPPSPEPPIKSEPESASEPAPESTFPSTEVSAEHPAEPQPSHPVPLAAGRRWNPVALHTPAYPELLPLTSQAYDLAPPTTLPAAPSQAAPSQEAEALSLEDVEATDACARVAEPACDETEHTDPAEEDRTPDASTPSEPDSSPLSEFNLHEALHYRFDSEDSDEASPSPRVAEPAPAEPEFLRKARREAFWSSKSARLSVAVLSVVLLALLAAQAALLWRDQLAQQWPASRPWLQQLCKLTSGCELAAPRDLDALVIDSSGLSPEPQGLQLTVLLRNRVDRAVAWPALELTLTDAQGGIEQRKVMLPGQYLPAPQASDRALRAGLAPGQQVQLSLHVQVSGAAPSGYKLVLFYP